MIFWCLQVQVTGEIQTMIPFVWNIDLSKLSYKTGTACETASSFYFLFGIEKMDIFLLLSWNKEASEDCKGKQTEITRKHEL